MSTTWAGPLKQTGALAGYTQKLISPGLGSDFIDLDLVEVLKLPERDAVLRDLAITISERGVAVFRHQKLDNETHKEVVNRIAALSGRPTDNTLMTNALYPLYGDDPQVITLVPERVAERYGYKSSTAKRQNHAIEWHSDMSFEENPSDYSSLRLGEVPESGGDTMYASCYDLYDRMSEPFQKLMESLTVSWGDPHYTKAVASEGTYRGPRGSPANSKFTFDAVHPAVRTNPVTGWKAIFAGGMHCLHFNDVTEEENAILMNMIEQLICRNHDLTTRVHWESPGDIAIWDNRSVKHVPTRNHVGKRKGYRVLSAGEKPFLAPNSMSREDAKTAKVAAAKAEPVQVNPKHIGTNGFLSNKAVTNGVSTVRMTSNGIIVH